MTTIIVTHEDNEVDEFAFESGDQVINIGRRSSNDVCIPNLSVSGMHAKVTIDDGSALLEDNNSTNGTYVNGRLISRQLLNDGDEIVIGKTRVTVQVSAPVTATQHSDTHGASVQDSYNEPPTLNTVSDSQQSSSFDEFDESDSSGYSDNERFESNDDLLDEQPMSLSEKAKLALGRTDMGRTDTGRTDPTRNELRRADVGATAARAFEHDTAVADAPTEVSALATENGYDSAHPLDGLDNPADPSPATAIQVKRSVRSDALEQPTVDDASSNGNAASVAQGGAVIEIQNGAKSGQVLPIDKPVTTLGRPGIQIAAIMRKPDGYFLMHIESDDSVEMPTLNRDSIGDDPVLLHSGDRLNVAGIDVEFMLS